MNNTIVYLLDDEPDLLELFSDVVEYAGLESRCFTQAKVLLEKVTEFEPGSILVLDLHMPEMDGIEVMRRLAMMNSAPALILVSGLDTGVLHSAEKLGKAHNLKIIASLSKPVPIGQLRELLESQPRNVESTVISPRKIESSTITTEELQCAIRQGQLILYYQPQYEIATKKLAGVEALVRWQHPQYGLVPPDHFIPLAEESGLIGELTHWAIEQVVHQEKNWQAQGLYTTVSVNISAADITSLTLPEQLAMLLAAQELAPERITLEVTESALMGELITSLDILTRMRLKGIRLSIDDFGTGYSSLSQLHRLPFTELKIDQSFVSNMTDDKEAKAIVKTCIILGHELNMTIVAEGVETEDQLDSLREMGCDIAQGYLLSRPVTADKIIDLQHIEL